MILWGKWPAHRVICPFLFCISIKSFLHFHSVGLSSIAFDERNATALFLHQIVICAIHSWRRCSSLKTQLSKNLFYFVVCLHASRCVFVGPTASYCANWVENCSIGINGMKYFDRSGLSTSQSILSIIIVIIAREAGSNAKFPSLLATNLRRFYFSVALDGLDVCYCMQSSQRSFLFCVCVQFLVKLLLHNFHEFRNNRRRFNVSMPYICSSNILSVKLI